MKTCIVISGGDAPGINGSIDCFLRLATLKGDRVIGAENGLAGLLDGQLVDIDRAFLSLMAGRAGSILTSSRKPALQASDARARLRKIMRQQEIDNLLLFGGDGTIRHALPLLTGWGIPCIVLPTTIDNDVAASDYTLGHDSACNFALQAAEGIRATGQALPGRIFMLETLGAPSGHLALAIAYACGADLVLLPEYPLEMSWLAERLTEIVAREGFAFVVLSEAYPDIGPLVEEIPRRTGIRIRYSALGHAQRGADISHHDRSVARDMSRIAWRAFKDGASQGVIVLRNGALTLHKEALPSAAKPPPDRALFKFVNNL